MVLKVDMLSMHYFLSKIYFTCAELFKQDIVIKHTVLLTFSVLANASTSTSLTKTGALKDSITSWEVTAISISRTNGGPATAHTHTKATSDAKSKMYLL